MKVEIERAGRVLFEWVIGQLRMRNIVRSPAGGHEVKKLQRRIEELEKKVRELETRPIVYPAIVIQPSPQPVPEYPSWKPFVPIWPGAEPHPFGAPWIVYNDGHVLS